MINIIMTFLTLICTIAMIIIATKLMWDELGNDLSINTINKYEDSIEKYAKHICVLESRIIKARKYIDTLNCGVFHSASGDLFYSTEIKNLINILEGKDEKE